MLRSIRTAAAATVAAAGFLAAAGSAQAGQQDFTIYNDSVQDIYYIFVSPDYSDNWGNDVLADAILPAGAAVDIRMDGYGSHCTFDIQVANAYGDTLEFWGVNLCTVGAVYVQ
jgi:hypothetical protein